MHPLDELLELFNQNYSDLEGDVYLKQKQSLIKGIKIKPLVKYLGYNIKYSHEIFNDYEKNIRYVLNKILFLEEKPKIRGQLGRPLLFKDDVCEFSLIHKNKIIKSRQNTVDYILLTRLNKYSFEDLVVQIFPQIKTSISEYELMIKLIEDGKTRVFAEEKDMIFKPLDYASFLKTNIISKLDLLKSSKNKSTLKERLKLWGIDEIGQNLSFISPSDFGIKDLFILSLVDYGFLRESSNEEIFNIDPLFKSYHKKIVKLSELLSSQYCLEARIF